MAKRWKEFINCIVQWLCLSGESKTIAEIYQHCITMDFTNVPEDAGFHPTYYRRSINKKRLDSFEKHERQHPGVHGA